MGGLLVIVSMVTGTASCIALFRPLPRIGLPTRRRAFGVWAASWILLGIGGNLLPEPAQEGLPGPAREELPEPTQEETAEIARVRDEALARETERTPEQLLRSEIISELGTSNRDVDRLQDLTYSDSNVRVRWAINDNLTQGWRTAGARGDAQEILRVIAESGLLYQTVELEGTFSLVDVYGNSEESVVIQAEYTKATLDLVNWDSFRQRNVFLIAERSTIHRDLR